MKHLLPNTYAPPHNDGKEAKRLAQEKLDRCVEDRERLLECIQSIQEIAERVLKEL